MVSLITFNDSKWSCRFTLSVLEVFCKFLLTFRFSTFWMRNKNIYINKLRETLHALIKDSCGLIMERHSCSLVFDWHTTPVFYCLFFFQIYTFSFKTHEFLCLDLGPHGGDRMSELATVDSLYKYIFFTSSNHPETHPKHFLFHFPRIMIGKPGQRLLQLFY